MGAAPAVIVAAQMASKFYGDWEASQANEETAKQNAAILRARSADALQRGARQAGLLRMKGTAIASQQKVGMAKGNVEVSSGTPLAILETTAGMNEVDALTAKNNAARAAWGFDVEAQNEDFKAKLAKKKRSILGMAGTFAGGAGSMAAYGGGGSGAAGDYDGIAGAQYANESGAGD